jgi:hypothetical protein
MRFEILEPIGFKLDRFFQKPGVATGVNVQSRDQLFEWREVRGPVILEDLPSNTLARSLLGLRTEIWEFVQLVAWPADSIFVQVNITEIKPVSYSWRMFVTQIVFFLK